MSEFHKYEGGSCIWLCRVFCFFGSHRWTHPGGHCECCAKCDEFFGPHPCGKFISKHEPN